MVLVDTSVWIDFLRNRQTHVSHDCLVAQVAIEHGVPLLHDDRDFEAIASVNPSLKLHTQPH